ncbi:twitching motility protein PilT [candidate division WOR-3 bacterium]|nr:twitching motility protein PilT [candidate division WOR-3 bacterium]
MISIEILFHDELNDFLPKEKKFRSAKLDLITGSQVKDIIESQGVPHTEFGVIFADGKEVLPDYKITYPTTLEVFPQVKTFMVKIKFIADVHLGILSRRLRLLGFDCKYQNNFEDSQIADIAQKESRTVLTRDVQLLMRKKVNYGYWIRNTKTEDQIIEVCDKFALFDQINPFSLCTECGGKLSPVEKKQIISEIPWGTSQRYNEFYVCSGCGKIYWKGSHFFRLQKIVEYIKSSQQKR